MKASYIAIQYLCLTRAASYKQPQRRICVVGAVFEVFGVFQAILQEYGTDMLFLTRKPSFSLSSKRYLSKTEKY